MAKRKRRKLRKWVYVALFVLLVLMILVIIGGYKKYSKPKYSEYLGNIEKVDIQFVKENSIYTYTQNYFNLDQYTFLSLNDLYNVYSHLDQAQMILLSKKESMIFTLNELKVEYNYHHERFSILEGNLQNDYLKSFNIKKNTFTLKKLKLDSYIVEGEVYLEKQLIEHVLFNDECKIDLENKQVVW